MNSKNTLVGLGEVLWDVFPDGARFGGAPANFASSVAHLAAGGSRVYMVSAVGKDDRGAQAITKLQEKGVDTTHVQQVDFPTGTVDVELDEDGKATYSFADNTAWDNLYWQDSLADLAAATDAVCFGTLAQRSERSRDAIERFVEATPPDALRIFDINIRPPFHSEAVIRRSLELANVLKLNDDELSLVADLYGCSGSTELIVRQLCEKCDLKCLALTCGSDGSILIRDGQLDRQGGVPTEVVDTVGAGDAFTASMTLGLLAGKPLDEINRRAARVAAYVCSQGGATPPIPDDLR